eukprot:g4874.t1
MPNRATNLGDEQHQSSYWREALWKAGMLAETHDKACLFIHVNTHNHDEPCATRAPQWNGGADHIMMDFTRWWRAPCTSTAPGRRRHDERNGIVSVLRCFEQHGEHRWPENFDYCAQAWLGYSAYSYEDLMNSTSALVPAGRSPGTFRP